MIKQHFLYKYQFAEKIGISNRTLCRWLNEKYFDQLIKLDYYKKQRYLNPGQLKFLCEKLDLTNDL